MATGADQPLTVVGLGELLWDCFPDGRQRLGGAPANVAYHAAALGDGALLATRVGRDPAGDRALSWLADRGVDVSVAQRDPRRPTGTAQVTLDRGQPRFAIDPAGAWAWPQWTPRWARALARAQVVCYGTLMLCGEAGREVLRRARAASGPDALWLLDLNLRPGFDGQQALDAALAAANAVKLSEQEAYELGRRLGQRDAPGWLLRRPGMRAVAVTRGARGSLLLTPGGHHDHPGHAVETAGGDSVGAGDAFTAALAHHLARGHGPARASQAANRLAAHVASRPGAMPGLPRQLRRQLLGPG
jgi:fructokinase